MPDKADFPGFMNLREPKRTPGRETIEKIGPSTLGAWMDCNERATTTDAATESERDERDAGSRRLAYVLLVSAIGLYGAYAACSWL